MPAIQRVFYCLSIGQRDCCHIVRLFRICKRAKHPPWTTLASDPPHPLGFVSPKPQKNLKEKAGTTR